MSEYVSVSVEIFSLDHAEGHGARRWCCACFCDCVCVHACECVCVCACVCICVHLCVCARVLAWCAVCSADTEDQPTRCESSR